MADRVKPLTSEEKSALRERTKRELERLEAVYADEATRERVAKFKEKFGICEIVYKVVFADEMDRVLNPVLSERVIAYVNGKQHSGQFIFSTHNVLHLDLKTYMKEQIYFITKTRNLLSSELYSLSDFPEVRYETTKIYEFYMKGILGGTADE